MDEGEPRPSFKVLPTTNYIMWSRMNVIDNCKLLGNKTILVDDMILNGALEVVCRQVDDLTLHGYPILDDVVITCSDDNTYAAEYGKMYTILAENLATMMVDVRVTELLLDYLYLCQKICIGRYLYEIRDVITDDVLTGVDMFGKLNNFSIYTQRESMKVSKSDPLTRFEVVTYDREAIKYVGVNLDHIRSMFKMYNDAIERSRIFYVPDEIYNS